MALQGHSHLRTFSATGADDDIVVSSVRAYISAVNKLMSYVSKSEKRDREKAALEEGLAAQKSLKVADEGVVTSSLSPIA